MRSISLDSTPDDMETVRSILNQASVRNDRVSYMEDAVAKIASVMRLNLSSDRVTSGGTSPVTNVVSIVPITDDGGMETVLYYPGSGTDDTGGNGGTADTYRVYLSQ